MTARRHFVCLAYLFSNRQSAIAMGSHRFVSLGIIKCPTWGILLYLAETKGLFRWRCITWQNLRIRANRRTPVRLFAAVRTLGPRVRIHIIKHNKKSRHTGVFFIVAETKYSLARCIRIGCGATVTI